MSSAAVFGPRMAASLCMRSEECKIVTPEHILSDDRTSRLKIPFVRRSIQPTA